MRVQILSKAGRKNTPSFYQELKKMTLNDYQKKQLSEKERHYREVIELQKAVNASLKLGGKCKNQLRTEKDCARCTNQECKKAYKELEKLWKDKDSKAKEA
jgi:hypothetical protein